MIEWCDVLRHYVCVVCARTWIGNTRAPMYGVPVFRNRAYAPPNACEPAPAPAPGTSRGPDDVGALRRRWQLVIAALEALARQDDQGLAEAALETAVDCRTLLDALFPRDEPYAADEAVPDDLTYLRRSGTRRSLGPS